MSADPAVSVIIPTWNGRSLLDVCLPSLEKQSRRDFEVIVVDNGSTDGTEAYLRESWPAVRLIRFDDNRGFAAAVNTGIRAAAGEIIVLLNNDTEADADWLEKLCGALEENPSAGSCASKVVRYDDRSIIDSAGDELGLLADQIGHGAPDSSWFSQPRHVLTACAAAAAYRRELFDRVGLFDERFSSYLEDVDIGIRAQLVGLTCLYVPGARIAHMGSATAQRIGGTRLYLLLRNSLFIFFQYMPRSVLLLWGAVMLVWPFYYALRTGTSPRIAARALVDFLRDIPEVARRRRWVHLNRTITPGEFRAKLVPHPFVASVLRRRRKPWNEVTLAAQP
jgi:hypothetical protein